ncbi:CU044_2847 family protein [Amycolatopsis umgeniensis]|uniref:ABC-type molybdate transport system substrate-binding protein n=1 Tax=Amycolatopsis umgeniensis TaxID=336628 RepID=A0A841AUU7_9PSEU|nr:ABC-type molybdate transport system substrate-binding protein [Amycolatopsis umgeniensis]
MAGQVVPMRFGGVEVLVTTVPVAGTEPTSRLGDAGAKALDAFGRAHEVIVGAAASTVEVLGKLAAESTRPTKLEVEFGLGFSAKGNVIVAGGSVDATLKVKLTYEPQAAE